MLKYIGYLKELEKFGFELINAVDKHYNLYEINIYFDGSIHFDYDVSDYNMVVIYDLIKSGLVVKEDE